MSDIGDNAAKDVVSIIERIERLEEEKKQIQDILQKKRDTRETPVGKTGYFQQRFDSAKEIIDQPGKLARLIASGPGKVAADVYNANKVSGKDFKQTYDTLTATYEDDKEALKVVNAPVEAVELPIAGGLAKYVLKPVPETVDEADKVVNAPVEAVELPIAGGLARQVLKPVPETVDEADRVVNAPVDAVEAPTVILLIEPKVPEEIVIVPAPVVVKL